MWPPRGSCTVLCNLIQNGGVRFKQLLYINAMLEFDDIFQGNRIILSIKQVLGRKDVNLFFGKSNLQLKFWMTTFIGEVVHFSIALDESNDKTDSV